MRKHHPSPRITWRSLTRPQVEDFDLAARAMPPMHPDRGPAAAARLKRAFDLLKQRSGGDTP
ncbi:MAG: hypothetical protein WA747_04535, partial [Steroidobacteraceae bacterium]